jgi:hypothetical protein
MNVMDTRLDMDKLGLRSSETLIHYQESQFMNCIGVEAPPSSLPKSYEEEATIETPKKLKGLRIKVCPDLQTNFQQLAR